MCGKYETCAKCQQHEHDILTRGSNVVLDQTLINRLATTKQPARLVVPAGMYLRANLRYTATSLDIYLTFFNLISLTFVI